MGNTLFDLSYIFIKGNVNVFENINTNLTYNFSDFPTLPNY